MPSSLSSALQQRKFLPTDCPLAYAVANVIDGAAERAVLIDATDEEDDYGNGNVTTRQRGKILHMNTAAINFLFVNEDNPYMTDFLVFGDDGDGHGDGNTIDGKSWTSITGCRVRKKDGIPTRNERKITWVSTTCPESSKQGQERKYLVAYICSKHERVREVMDHAFDPVVTTDENGIIRTANKAAYDLFGYDLNTTELTSQNVAILCGDGHSKHHQDYIQKYNETGVKKIVGTRREVTGLKKDGTEFPCELGSKFTIVALYYVFLFFSV
jgi:PAS domain S-box-containing protein